jgi:hypothetical protein
MKNATIKHRYCSGSTIHVVVTEHQEIVFECDRCHKVWVPVDKQKNIWLPNVWKARDK